MTQEATLEELTAKKPQIAEAFIIVDSDIAERWRAALAKVDRLQYRNQPEELAEAKDEVEALVPEVAAAERVIRFKAIGRKAYRELQEAHEPTKEQRKDARDNGLGEPMHNPVTFPPALIAASAIAPEMTLAQAEAIWNSPNWSAGELALLYTTATTVNASSDLVSLGKESERTQD
jgi:hypothetical protein